MKDHVHKTATLHSASALLQGWTLRCIQEPLKTEAAVTWGFIVTKVYIYILYSA